MLELYTLIELFFQAILYNRDRVKTLKTDDQRWGQLLLSEKYQKKGA